jgi:hypothetical protein
MPLEHPKMTRIILIAMASLLSFSLLTALMPHVTANSTMGAWISLGLGFVATPFVLLRFWLPTTPGAKCPEGRGLYPECLFVVTIDAGEVVVQRPDGTTERVAISELQELSIVTDDSGPAGADRWWLLVGRNGSGCAFPGGATGEMQVLAWAQQLPGFDTECFIRSTGSTSNARFSCWKATSLSAHTRQ